MRAVRLGGFFLLLAALSAPAAAPARDFIQVIPADPEAGRPAVEAVRGELILRFRPGAGQAVRQAALAGAQAVRPVGRGRARALQQAGGGIFDDLAVVTLPADADLAAAAAAWSARPGVLYAEPNLRLRLAAEPAAPRRAPNDFEFPRQWALENTGQTGGRAGADIRAPAAWAVTTGSRDVVVAVIDTGVDLFHPDLAGNLWVNPGEIPGNGVDDDGNGHVDDLHGYDFVWDDRDPLDDQIHGTHVAGIIGARTDNEDGIAGVAWEVRLMALKAFDETGSAAIADTVSAIRYALDNGARIINASWGGTARSRALDDAVAECAARGVLFVAAAGNQSNDAPFYPAASPGALAVAATDARDQPARFTNHGRFVALAAPGDVILSTTPDAAVGELSGTSMAAPHVAGAAALVWSRHPHFTAEQVADALRHTADPLAADRFLGSGRLNAARAVGLPSPLPRVALAVPPVLAGVLDVRGTAAAPDLDSWTLELGRGDSPADWTVLAAAAAPVEDGPLLAGWNTAAVDDGTYALRLTAVNRAGFTARALAPVRVRNVHLAAPQNNDIVRAGEMLELHGTVFGAGRHHRLEWGFGGQPAVWRTDGFIPDPGDGGLVDARLGVWDSAVAGADQFVTLRLTAWEGGRPVGDSRARLVFLDGGLRAGFPQPLWAPEATPRESWREFNVADLDGDGAAEIVAVDFGGPAATQPQLTVRRGDGPVRWSRLLPDGLGVPDDPTIGDLDGDGVPEIAVEAGPDGALFVFRADGSDFGPGWPARPGGRRWGKTIADLDGDGRGELILLAGEAPRALVVLDAAGRVRDRWPLGECAERETADLRLLPTVARLQPGAGLDLVAVNDCRTLRAFRPGRAEPLWTAQVGGLLKAPPAAADLTGDGRDEIIVAVAAGGPGRPGGVHVLDAGGRPHGNWPVLLRESFAMPPAVGDVDGDGRPEVALIAEDTRQVHLLDAAGFPLEGWPAAPVVDGSPRSPPILADVDGDGRPEVVVAMTGQWNVVQLTEDLPRAAGVRAFGTDGREVKLQPHPRLTALPFEGSGGPFFKAPAAAAADLDGAGFLSLVAASVEDTAYSPDRSLRFRKGRATLYGWATGAPARPAAAPWPARHGGPARTGRLDLPPPVNRPPLIAALPPQTVAPGGTFRPLQLDRYVDDPDDAREVLAWSVEAPPELAVRLDAARVLTVETAAAGWTGRAEVRLTVRDPAGNTATAVAAYAAIEGFMPPLARPDFFETDEDVPADWDVAANDSSPDGGPVRVLSVSRPGHGTTRLLPDGRVRYAPAKDWSGEDAFEYVIADARGGGAAAEVRVTVRPVPDPPVAVPDQLVLDEDSEAELDVLENDHDPDGDPITLVSVQPSANAAVRMLGGGRVRYTPKPDFFGGDSFEYVITDGRFSSTGQVAVIVRPVNDAPRIAPREFTLNRNMAVDVPLVADDPDGDPLTFTIEEGPAHGELLAYPTLATYLPRRGFAGMDRFIYRASDGAETSGPGLVTFRVLAANNPPVLRLADTVTAVDQPVTLAVNATDADDDPLHLAVARAPAHGTLTVEGTNAVYRPDPGFEGEDLVELRAGDGADLSPPAAARVRVTRENTPPTAESFFLTAFRNQPLTLTLRGRDAENNPLTYLLAVPPERGAVTLEGERAVYAPRSNFTGFDRFTYLADDGRLASEPAVVTLRVVWPNRPPQVTNSLVYGSAGQPLPIALPAVDPDGHPLAVAILKGPRFGRLSGSGTNLVYIPNPGFGGTDQFTWKVWDGFAYSAVAQVSLDLRGPPRPELLALRRPDLAGGGFTLAARMWFAGTLTLEASDDLRRWREIESRATSGGEVVFQLGAEAAEAAQFFRLRAR